MKTFKMYYYNTYYFANIIENVITDSSEYLTKLSEFYETSMILSDKFEKYSILHQFIAFVIDYLFYENIEEDLRGIENINDILTQERILWINDALDNNNIRHESFRTWLKDIGDSEEHPEDLLFMYMNEFLLDEKNILIEKLTKEVFHLMFMNRKFLLLFNYTLSSHISLLNFNDIDDDLKKILKKPGVLKRISIPNWVKNAVFFRDRGHCVLCDKDLTNLITRLSIKNFDHIVPLNHGGVNDISNIQLTCEFCNLKKHDKEIKTSSNYELWY